jgi:outer membrane protein TolC
MTWQNGRLRKSCAAGVTPTGDRFIRLLGATLVAVCVAIPPPVKAEGIAQLYADAKAKNINNIRTQYNLEISDAVIDEARSSLLPQLSASGNETYKDPKYDFGTEKKTRVEDYTIRLSQPLLNMQAWGGLSESKLSRQVSELQVRKSDTDFLKLLMNFYLKYLEQADLLKISNLQLESTEAQLRQAESMFKAGMIVITSVYEARSSLDLAKSAHLQVQRSLQVLQQELYDFLRSRTVSVDVYVKGLRVTDPLSLPIAELGAEGYQQNYDLQIAQKRQELLEESLETAYNEYYPTVDLVASQLDNNAPNTKKDQVLTLALNVPIFQGGRTTARVKQGSLRVDDQKEVVYYTSYQIDSKIKDIVDNYLILSDQYRSQVRAEVSSTQALFSLEVGFKAGERTIADVLSAQSNVFEIRQRLNALKFEMIGGYLELYSLTRNIDLAFAEKVVE